jgi:hypothetical protein
VKFVVKILKLIILNISLVFFTKYADNNTIVDIKKTFEKFDDKNAFIKVSTQAPVESSQKAVLNRKGNQLFNDGDIEGARRIFMTTGYSDGLARVGDFYKSKDRLLEALKMYWIAPDRKKSAPLIEQLAGVMKSLLNEDEDDEHEGLLYEGEENIYLQDGQAENDD